MTKIVVKRLRSIDALKGFAIIGYYSNTHYNLPHIFGPLAKNYTFRPCVLKNFFV